MIEKEIVEGNKLIAEFMGKKFKAYRKNSMYDQEFSTYDECLTAIKKNNWGSDYKPELGWGLGMGRYDNSWDWLMKVVEKIEDLGYNSELYHHGGTNGFLFVEVLDNGSDIEGIAPTKIEATWLACVQFIKWYNQQKGTHHNSIICFTKLK